MGAITSDGQRVLNQDVIRALRIAPATLDSAALAEHEILQQRERDYRGGAERPVIRGRTVVLVDDGLATGASMRAVILAVRRYEPRRVIVAVPVAPAETCDALRAEGTDVVCLLQAEDFYGVSEFYEDFTQTSDSEVRALLELAAADSRLKRAALPNGQAGA